MRYSLLVRNVQSNTCSRDLHEIWAFWTFSDISHYIGLLFPEHTVFRACESTLPRDLRSALLAQRLRARFPAKLTKRGCVFILTHEYNARTQTITVDTHPAK